MLNLIHPRPTKGQLLYTCTLNLEGTGFEFKTYRVDLLGSEFYGVVRLGPKGEKRSGVRREKLQYFSNHRYQPSPALALEHAIRACMNAVGEAQSAVLRRTAELALAAKTKLP